LATAPDWRIDALGAYFAWVRVPDAAPDSTAAAERLAAERGVVSLPGGVFGPGGERHLRLAFANTDEGAIAAVPERLAGLYPRPSAARGERVAAPGAAAPGRPFGRSP
jgi:aspartate/methionine/tyrosine aminotransferase